MSVEIAPEAPKPGKVGQEAFLGESDRQETTTYGIPVAFHEETSHSVRNSRSLAPQLGSDTTCPGGGGAVGPGTWHIYFEDFWGSVIKLVASAVSQEGFGRRDQGQGFRP